MWHNHDLKFVTTNLASKRLSPFGALRAAHPGWSDRRIAHALCEDLLDEAAGGVPVDVELVASLSGIAQVEYHHGGPSGMLFFRQGRWIASVRSSDNLGRQRFSILHESAHALAPELGGVCGLDPLPGLSQDGEAICDSMASQLLLPGRFFKEDLAFAGSDLKGAEALADRYLTSLTAACIRAVDLAATPAMLLVLQVGHKPAERGAEWRYEPKLRLAWAHHQGRWPYALRHKSVAPNSVLGRAWAGEHVDEVGSLADVLAEDAGLLSISARRYGDQVLALAHRAQPPAAN